MTNYEELYRNETGKNTRGRSNSYFEKWYHYEFVYWLIQKLSDKDKLLTAEVSRREAAEDSIMRLNEFIDFHENPDKHKNETGAALKMGCVESLKRWQSAITAYNKAVGR